MTQETEMTEIGNADGCALTFSLQGETFAIPVAHVNEIIDPLPITRVPNADTFAPGLINVRGSIAPLVDMRSRLGMPPSEPGETSRVLVLDLMLDGEATRVAMMADSVDDIAETSIADLEAVPELGVRWPTEYLKGVAKRDGKLVILLDVETAFAPVASI